MDMTTTVRLRLAFAQTVTKTVPGMPPTRPPATALDTSAVCIGCPFCDDAGCRDCRPQRISAIGTIAPTNVGDGDDDDDTITTL